MTEFSRELFGSRQEAESLRAELSALVAERDQAVTNGAELNRQLRAERDVLVAERDKAVAEMTEFNRHLAKLESGIENFETEIATREKNRAQVTSKKNEKQIAQLKLELDRQRARNERLVRTVSWRVTAPLRSVARWFKSKRKA
jgi:chromosome segregation ATPase